MGYSTNIAVMFVYPYVFLYPFDYHALVVRYCIEMTQSIVTQLLLFESLCFLSMDFDATYLGENPVELPPTRTPYTGTVAKISYVCVGVAKGLLHCESKKNKTPNSCPYLHQIFTDFQNSFTVRLSRKFVTKLIPHHKYPTTP